MADLQQDTGLAVPAVLFPMEEIVEEAQLQFTAVIGVKMRPVLDAVGLQSFLFGLGAHKPLEIAARVQALAAPIRR